jgi:hypothetical protein
MKESQYFKNRRREMNATVTTPSARTQCPLQGVTDVPRPNPSGSNPKPEDATTAILAAFEKYEVVGMSAAHVNKDLDNFILDLIRNPAFPSTKLLPIHTLEPL